ncbi:DUF2004 domain-containing protein [Acinetobacter colistiniresistens]|uniref:DUF2004 domain-containing protein n=2 Tax=Acinetobacter colistiniresistens TaxID=280145 RepID=A0A558FPT2_9GAMM|nr:DUF2004 domain-containing protein [Acinetobacter colistiniresistens]TVT87530.1 DUF2004 domain-containing protein [Acinetobacter colistiniresistens]
MIMTSGDAMSEQAMVEHREQLARIAMREALENQQAEDSVELFIQHHLEEVEPAYWQKHFGTSTPTSLQVLEFLVLDHQWEEDGLEPHDMLDFTLPDEITNYVICVSFDAKGQVIDIAMES